MRKTAVLIFSLSNKKNRSAHHHALPLSNLKAITMNKITRRDIEALVDDELDHETSKTVIAHINNNRGARIFYEEAIAQKKLLKSWWKIQAIG